MADLEKLKKEDNGAMAVYDTNNMNTQSKLAVKRSSTNNTDSWTSLMNHPSISSSPTITTRSN
jgi:hypothetical protein